MKGIFNTDTAQKTVWKLNSSIKRYEEICVKIIASTAFYLKCKHTMNNFDDFESNQTISLYWTVQFSNGFLRCIRLMRIQRYYSRCKRVKTDFDIQEILKINQIQNIFDGFPMEMSSKRKRHPKCPATIHPIPPPNGCGNGRINHY